MKERGIIFAGESVRAIISGRKTQTRRIVKPRHDFYMGEREGGSSWPYFEPYVYADPEPIEVPCPYGVPGDRLCVKETWRPSWHDDIRACVEYRADGAKIKPTIRDEGVGFHFFGECDASEPTDRWRSSMFMPRWASRLTLEVVAVRVERLQEITEADAIAEGCEGHPVDGHAGYPIGGSPVDEYRDGWNSINGKRAPWASNPWVWAVTFRMLP